ncbi:hypothetical protein ACIF8T_01135 [Streptomyces sp. NPDC085946]|uniref:hypothetical protein n=1 Tax=Streptomyces sp. NPDC085946 TaxID=3365744 RepID=UPI0037D71F5D
MKSLKAAALVAGSLVAAGAAAPAYAYDPAALTPTSINGAVDAIGKMKRLDVMPLKHQSNALDTENKDSALSTVKEATTTLNSGGGLLGGLPLRR